MVENSNNKYNLLEKSEVSACTLGKLNKYALR